MGLPEWNNVGKVVQGGKYEAFMQHLGMSFTIRKKFWDGFVNGIQLVKSLNIFDVISKMCMSKRLHAD